MKVYKQFGWSSILALMILNFALAAFSLSANAADRDDDYRNKARTDTANQPQSAPVTPTQTAETSQPRIVAADAKPDGKKPPAGSADCIAAGDSARQLCNTMSMVGVDDPAQGAMMEMMMNQAMGMASQIQSSGANGAQQCSNQAKLSELMAGINAIKAAACMYGQSRCSSRCETANEPLTAAIEAKAEPASAAAKKDLAANQAIMGKCKAYTINTMMAAMQAVKFGGSMLQSQACAAALSQTPTIPVVDGLTLPSGAADCSDPGMASSNISCICAANPSATICGGVAGNNLGGTVGGGLGGVGPGNAPRPYSDNTVTDGIPASGLGSPAPQSGVAGGPPGGGGGGGLGAGAGGPAGGGGEDPGGAAPVDKQSVIGGVSNGGGGGSGTAGNPNGSGGKGSGDGKGFFDKFNLSKFLPSKKNFGSRGLAGMSVQSKDGITGPMGPSLWEKVTNQYQVQKPKMIQDK